MTELMQVYKCAVCGNVVEVLHAGVGELVCCGQPMNLLEEKASEEGNEKHLPVITEEDGKTAVKIGSVAHPMEEKHYIEWISLDSNGRSSKVFLKPGDEPKAYFKAKAEGATARAYCNVHGLWKK